MYGGQQKIMSLAIEAARLNFMRSYETWVQTFDDANRYPEHGRTDQDYELTPESFAERRKEVLLTSDESELLDGEIREVPIDRLTRRAAAWRIYYRARDHYLSLVHGGRA